MMTKALLKKIGTAGIFFAAASVSAAFAESEYGNFAEGYVEYLGMYADAGTESDVEHLQVQLMVMPSDDPWLQQAAKTLLSAADLLERDPAASREAVLQSALYVTKGLSEPNEKGEGLKHRLTNEERVVILQRLDALRAAEWIRSNEAVMTTAKIFSEFLEAENPAEGA